MQLLSNIRSVTNHTELKAQQGPAGVGRHEGHGLAAEGE
jgi:hypothetical protein